MTEAQKEALRRYENPALSCWRGKNGDPRVCAFCNRTRIQTGCYQGRLSVAYSKYQDWKREIVAYLSENGPQNRRSIAEHCHISGAWTTTLLRKLRKDGYVRKVKVGSEDKRQQFWASNP